MTNTLPNFQVDPIPQDTNRVNEEKMIRGYINEINKYGFAYCYNDKIQNILINKGYKLMENGLVVKG